MQSRAIAMAMSGLPRRQFVIRFVSSKDDGRAMAVVAVAWSGAYALRLPTSVPTMTQLALPLILALDPHCMHLRYFQCPQHPQSLVPAAHP